MSTEEMLVVKRGYDFSKWLLNHTGKFPKSYRFSVATKIENAILDFIKSRKRIRLLIETFRVHVE